MNFAVEVRPIRRFFHEKHPTQQRLHLAWVLRNGKGVNDQPAGPFFPIIAASSHFLRTAM